MVDWLDRLDAELDNLGAALEWGLEAEPWTAVRMATALLGYWTVRVMSQDNEARIVAAIELARARVLDRPDADPADQALAARLLGEAARLWAMSGRAIMALALGRGCGRAWRSERRSAARLAAARRARHRDGLRGPGGSRRRGGTAIFEEATDLAEQSDDGGCSRWPRGSPGPA